MCSPGCLNRCSFLIHTLHRLMHIPTKMRAVKIEFDLESGEQQENGITFERLREYSMWHGEVRDQERSRLQCFSLSETLPYRSGECWLPACMRHTINTFVPLKDRQSIWKAYHEGNGHLELDKGVFDCHKWRRMHQPGLFTVG